MNERTTRADDGQRLGTPPRRARAPNAATLPPYVATAMLVAATLGVGTFLHDAFGLPDAEMLFLLAVMVTAVWFGRGPALLASGLGVACYDFFFIDPRLTFDVANQKYVLTFAMMFAVGLVSSELTGRLKRQERDAVAREARTAVLYALSREFASADEPSRIAEVAALHAADAFAARAFVLRGAPDGTLAAVGAYPVGAELDATERETAARAHASLAPVGLGTASFAESTSLGSPLRLGDERLGVLMLSPRDGHALHTDQRAFLEVFCRQVTIAFERARLAEYARTSALRAETEAMRSSLLSAVSHDLRTPLASITGAASSLRDDANLAAETRDELVRSICDEAVRLERLVANLLDMTRLEAGALVLARDWVPADEMIGSALTRLESLLGDRPVDVRLAADLPMLLVDPVLFEQVFINLLENSSRYTPPGSMIEIDARATGTAATIEILDRGPGLPAGYEERAFEKFYRGPQAGRAGAGLGLAICRAIVDAHGGSIRAENRTGGGLVVRIELPVRGAPPPVPHPEGTIS